ncbi:transporter associated domain-containing protein [Chitinimonas viridis]|uniref:Magnesium and cobalt efflux protein CorC n=2 Tax=Chitinimonas TaxID=240411 RepID=A0ABT8B2P7_9NEIS|nr:MULTISPECIES: transporter associated domain-containing protein [Chitinimonas]MBL8507164.1 CBS domain-containing protein [Chitinimonas sp.]MDN3575759.1 transporter associated domain-containing protein [Chitinimonas viridis]GLR13875.1 cation transporter [Chitinimonas prasina]
MDLPSSRSPKPNNDHKPNWLERLTAFLLREPEDRQELVELLHSAFERHLLDADALEMIEGVLQVGDLQVRDVMVPRSQMDAIDIATPPEDFIPYVIDTAHSRFPVYEGSKDNIVGILLAKDLLRYYVSQQFALRPMLRPAVFIPESKRLNVLLKEFRANRNHMAIVVDEYGGVAGLVTIEDVVEQIVGDIEDEYDFDETEDNIRPDKQGRWRVKATTLVGDLNIALGSAYQPDGIDTVGGLVVTEFGRVPKRGDAISIEGYHFRVIRADSRRVYSLLVEREAASDET